MGRKSVKSKERKNRWKEENEATEKMWKLVAEAEKDEDPLSSFVSFQRYTKNDLQLTLSCHRGAALDKSVIDWAFNLTKRNMEGMYITSGWGWRDREKRQEMLDSNARLLIARDENGAPVGFVNFRYDLDYGDAVLYCYEIQVEPRVQKKGLGVFLMQILQLLAIKNKLSKVVVTVFTLNKVSLYFFKKLRFSEDVTNPDDEKYLILSKPVRQGK